MSDLLRAVEALTHAIEAQSVGGLALVNELAASREIQANSDKTLSDINSTLGRILDGQSRIETEIGKLNTRTGRFESRAGESEGRIKLVESRLDQLHAQIKPIAEAHEKAKSAAHR